MNRKEEVERGRTQRCENARIARNEHGSSAGLPHRPKGGDEHAECGRRKSRQPAQIDDVVSFANPHMLAEIASQTSRLKGVQPGQYCGGDDWPRSHTVYPIAPASRIGIRVRRVSKKYYTSDSKTTLKRDDGCCSEMIISAPPVPSRA